MTGEPLRLPVPKSDEPGRLLRLRPDGPGLRGLTCRWCPNLLAATPGGALVCLRCDAPTPQAR